MNKMQLIPVKNILSDHEKRSMIRQLDLQVWTAFAPKVKPHENSPGSYWCYCPYCDKGRKKGTHNLTGLVYEHSNGDGLGFSCLACNAKHPRVFQFLGGAGSSAAEEYAEKRLEIGAVRKGWYCPSPQRWKQEQEQAKRLRAAQYKAEAERRKRDNKVAYALREGEALSATAPRTTSHAR